MSIVLVVVNVLRCSVCCGFLFLLVCIRKVVRIDRMMLVVVM